MCILVGVAAAPAFAAGAVYGTVGAAGAATAAGFAAAAGSAAGAAATAQAALQSVVGFQQAAQASLFSQFTGYLFSPQFSLATQAVGFGLQMIGQGQRATLVDNSYALREAILRNQQIVKQQEIQLERERELVRQQLLSREGRQQRAQARIGIARLGQLVDVGSAKDITSDIAAETAFRKTIAGHESDLYQRNLAIQAQDANAQLALTGINRAAEFEGFRTQLAAGAVQFASGFGKSFRRDKGGLAFRT